MAYKDSGEIANNSNYVLGDYSFRIERTSVPGSTNDKIEAICTKDGKNARKSIQIPSNQNLGGWYVEANETEATVYAVVKVPKGGGKTSPLDTGNMPQPIETTNAWIGDYGTVYIPQTGRIHDENHFSGLPMACFNTGGSDQIVWIGMVAASATQGSVKNEFYRNEELSSTSYLNTNSSYTYDGKTVYYYYDHTVFPYIKDRPDAFYTCPLNVTTDGQTLSHPGQVAWTIIYGQASGDDYDIEEQIVGRFAIDLGDAGGEGPGSDWDDPGDYDPDWEEGDPTHTLYVEVTGALSGRHNDPIVDPSYSYIPSDKDTVKGYGCGGDGGNGGGGGAGASTVVVHKFATNQANYKEVTAIARRHGYGSGGGKGGKGGDGCILVYY